MVRICLEVVCPSEGRFVLFGGGLGSQGWGGRGLVEKLGELEFIWVLLDSLLGLCGCSGV